MKLNLDKIIISTNDDPDFYNFWELAYRGWKAFFPEIEMILTFITNRSEDDTIVTHLRRWGTVKLYKEIPGIPTPNLAKVSRMIEATKHGDAICMVNDIDLVPLQREYVVERLSHFDPDKLLGIGTLNHIGLKDKFPMGYTTAVSSVWNRIVNPNNLGYEDLVNSWRNIQHFDLQEAVNNLPADGVNPRGFSDESLLRYLRSREPSILNQIERGFVPLQDGVDRAAWSNLDIDRLNRGGYVEAHLLRPLTKYIKEINVIADYIKKVEREKSI